MQKSISGYYLTYLPRYQFKDVQLGRCQPWDPTVEVVIKKIAQPIPMFAKKVRAVVPMLDQAIGFDLSAGDWIAPFGMGKRSDLIFTLSRILNTRTDFTAKLILSFANNGDGIQTIKSDANKGASVLKLSRSAPEAGYASTWSTTLSHGSFGVTPSQTDFGYFIRVQSILQGDKITQAQYGKIDGPISIVGVAAEKPGIAFTYYLNPAGTTNLEFDPTKNLLTNLKDDDQVDAP
jgi:hypothetical protein